MSHSSNLGSGWASATGDQQPATGAKLEPARAKCIRAARHQPFVYLCQCPALARPIAALAARPGMPCLLTVTQLTIVGRKGRRNMRRLRERDGNEVGDGAFWR